MNNLFNKLFEVTDTADSLGKFLNENMLVINEFYNSNYSGIVLSKHSIERFILLKYNAISHLDYTKSYSKSFALMLLDYCERFNFISATPRICTILADNGISINSRLQAALLFLYPKPTSNSELVDKFDSICEKLQVAIETEEDNDKKSIATFLNYYSIIVNDTRLEFAEQVKNKIITAVQSGAYPFLQNENIATILSVELPNLDVAYKQIQNAIDNLLGKAEIVYPKDVEIDEKRTFLIETDTDYSRELQSVPNNFDSIRSISVRHANSQSITNRGVKILESEEELYEYMKRFGNMHKAKLQSALELLPQTFSSKVNIIDWGCGQGFASMVFLETFGNETVDNITLIEPSEIAIKRASLHLRKYNPNVSIQTICKKLDEISTFDLKNKNTDITIHLFSNILDIDDYSQSHLIELIESTQTNENYFVCVSPYIDDIKTDRLDSFKRHFENNFDTFVALKQVPDIKKMSGEYWHCNNNFKGSKCFNHSEKVANCQDKWTRVMRIFKVKI